MITGISDPASATSLSCREIGSEYKVLTHHVLNTVREKRATPEPSLGNRITRTKRGGGEIHENPSREKNNQNPVDFRLVLCNRASMSMEAVGRLEHLGVLCCLVFTPDMFLSPVSLRPRWGLEI